MTRAPRRPTARWRIAKRSWLLAAAAIAATVGTGLPAAASGGLPLQEYVNDGAGGHLWNAYNQTEDAQGPDITGRPSAITYGPTVQVFVQSDAGDLMSWVNDNIGGHLWNAYDLSQLAGGGGAISGNPDAVSSGPTVDVFVESAADDLIEYTNDGADGHLWNAYDLSATAGGGGPVDGDPSALFAAGGPAVFVRASSGDLVEYAEAGSTWTVTDLTGSASGGTTVSGDPSALNLSGTLDVFVRSAGGALVRYTEIGGSWATEDLSQIANGGAPVQSNPATILFSSTMHVYVASAGSELTEYTDDAAGGAGWDAYNLSTLAGGGATVQNDPSALVYGPTVHVYVQSGPGDLIEYVNDGVAGRLWNAYDLSQDAGAGGPIGTDPAAVLYGGSVVHVYAGGSNSCTSNLAGQLSNTGGAKQLITVDSPSYSSTTATLTAWQLVGGCWQAVFGPMTARVGSTGVSDDKPEGDGATPTGAYRIGSTIYGVDPNPGVSYAYHQLVCGDWWDEDPSSTTTPSSTSRATRTRPSVATAKHCGRRCPPTTTSR